MIKTLIKIGLVAALGFLGYNYFLGNETEKEKARNTVNKIKDVGKDLVDLTRSEIQNFKTGKYDNALDKISSTFNSAKDMAVEKGGGLLEQMEDWDSRRKDWQDAKDKIKDLVGDSDEAMEEKKDQIKELNEQGKALEKEGEKLREKLGVEGN